MDLKCGQSRAHIFGPALKIAAFVPLEHNGGSRPRQHYLILVWSLCKNPIRRLKDGLPRPQFQGISFKDAWPIVQDLALQVLENSIMEFRQGDEIKWLWNAHGAYSVFFFYKLMWTRGLIRWRFSYTRKTSTPLKVKVFIVLLLKKRLLTHEIMARRGMHYDPRYFMYVSCRQEIAHHIFFRYRYTTVVWREVARRKGREVMTIGNSVHQTWNKLWDKIKQGDVMPRKEWATLFMCILWSLWKKRNKKVFSDKMKPPSVLVQQILEKVQLWRYCTGLTWMLRAVHPWCNHW